MRIGIDCHAAEEGSSGNCTYIRNLLCGLASHDSDNEYVLFVNRRDHPFYRELANKPNVTFCRIRRTPAFYRVFAALPWASHRQKVDILHVQYFAPLFHRGKLVVTIHDVTPFRHPEYFSAFERLLFRVLLPPSARRASLVLTGCRNSKRDMVELLRLNESRIQVTYYGINRHFSGEADPAGDRRILNELGVHDPFILYVGRIDPRKNIPLLIEAFDLLRGQQELPHKLVIAGKVYLMPANMKTTLDRCRHAEDVLFLPTVSDGQLPALYRAASVFAFPSEYEGFGFPPLEAMASGVPVVASDISIFREILSDSALLVPAGEPAALANAIARILTEENLRSDLIRKGKEHVKKYDWQRTAMETLRWFQHVGREGGNEDSLPG